MEPPQLGELVSWDRLGMWWEAGVPWSTRARVPWLRLFLHASRRTVILLNVSDQLGVDDVMDDGPPALRNAGLLARTDDADLRDDLPEPALAYDYFKSMVSVSVATLGGILTLSGTVFGARITPVQMAIAALPVAISGVLALQGMTDVMQLCQRIKPLRNSTRVAFRLVPASYGLGLGAFLAFLVLSYFAR
jgi:hypothetical protein